jgi:RNA polymerase sigma-70 factor (ECF subfamily)
MRRAASRAGIHDPDEIDDVASEALLRAWRARRNFTGFPGSRMASLKGWVRVIARNTARERRHRAAVEEQAIKAHHDWHEPYDPGPEPPAEARSTLLRALLILPQPLRLAAIMVAFHGSLTEAAEDMGVPLGTASTRIRAARAKLRKRL